MRTAGFVRIALVLFLLAAAQAKDLVIYAIDTEGGKSTLFISPSGESLLVDAGYDGNNNRDADRIMTAVKAAGVNHIDHFVLTHYHGDHSGGVKQLASRIRIDHFYDHGPSVEASTNALADTWAAVHRGKHHTVLKPGDKVPVKGLDVRVVASAGELIGGAGEATAGCDASARPAAENGENSRSVAMMITYGKFRVAELGDLSPDREFDLACPSNKPGRADLYLTTHHGTGASGPPKILAALAPRAALMDNGATKGGSVKALETLRLMRGRTDLWQLHYSNAGGEKGNTAEPYIANMAEACEGKGIRVSASADGSFSIRNERNGFRKTYPAIN